LGEAIALARSQTESELIKGQSLVKQAEMKAQAHNIETESEISQLKKRLDMEYEIKKQENLIRIENQRKMAEIEVKKFQSMVNAIGQETLVSMARAGPETKAKMLQGLGLKGFLVTDGKNPINLFNTANGFLAS
jgi:major vault protein